MEFAFELIREAGIRIPGPIGPTLGIIGALILGQAAVAANIVSPILIIVVAVTGIGSFAIPNFAFAFSFRIFGLFSYCWPDWQDSWELRREHSFICFNWQMRNHSGSINDARRPKDQRHLTDQIGRAPIWKQERRPDYLNPKDEMRQEHISRQWAGENSIKKE